MRKRIKRIIAILIAITLFLGIDNISGYHIFIKYVGNTIITNGETLDGDKGDEEPETATTDGMDSESLVEDPEGGDWMNGETKPYFVEHSAQENLMKPVEDVTEESEDLSQESATDSSDASGEDEGNTSENGEISSEQEADAQGAESVTKQPETVGGDTESAAKQPESVGEDTESVTKQPESVSEDAESVTKQPESVSEDAEVATKQPESVTKDAESTFPEETTKAPETDLEFVSVGDQEEIMKPGEDSEILLGASYYESLTDVTEIEKNQTYAIRTVSDWRALAQFSQTNTFEDVTIIVYKNTTGAVESNEYVVQNLKIGNQTYPFSGTIYFYYSTTRLTTNGVIFDYLSSKAQIGAYFDKTGTYKFIINYQNNSSQAGLANNLVLEKEGCTVNIGGRTDSRYYVKVCNTALKYNGTIGGLFSHVYVEDNAVSPEGSAESIYQINMSGSGLEFGEKNQMTIDGYVVGGIIGEIWGDIDIHISSLTNNISQVQGTMNSSLTSINSNKSMVGGTFGYVHDGVKIVFTNTQTIALNTIATNNNITDNDNATGAYVGGFIGAIRNASATCEGPLIRTGSTRGAIATGSFIGFADNSYIKITDYTLGNDIYVYTVRTSTYTTNYWRASGGVIGWYQAPSLPEGETNASGLELAFIKSENKNPMLGNKVQITGGRYNANNSSFNVKLGGLVGIVDAGTSNVYIHDINTEANTTTENGIGGENSLNINLCYAANATNYTSPFHEAGGLAGVLAGEDILISDIIFKYMISGNCLAGYIVGDIAARTGKIQGVDRNTAIVVNNVRVYRNYCSYVYYTHGGLFGTVDNSLIALKGNIDLSGVPFKAQSNDCTNGDARRAPAGQYLLLGLYYQRGFVAGFEEQSIIYLDKDCVYTKAIEYDDDGSVKNFNSDTMNDASNGLNVYPAYSYCLDDVGGAGSIYRDADGIIDMSMPFGYQVTGTVAKDSQGRYVMASESDILRFAIAGNSIITEAESPLFGGNCFSVDGVTIPTADELLQSDYVCKTDLNLAKYQIQSLVNNYKTTLVFRGSMVGQKENGTNSVVTMNFVSRQPYGGMFPAIDGAQFENLDITGYLYYTRGYAGSIAAYATGDNQLTNVNISSQIRGAINCYATWTSDFMFYYGGAIGYAYGGKLTCNNCVIDPKITVFRADQHIGGLVGWYRVDANHKADITLNGCTLSTDITTTDLYNYWGQNYNRPGREAGLIGILSSEYRNVGDASNLAALPATLRNETFANITINNMVIDDSNIDLTTVTASTTSATAIYMSGGFLGYVWMSADVTIDGLTIKNSKLYSRGQVGGLVSFFSGRMNIKNCDIQSLDMKDVGNNGYYSYANGLLIGNGQNAIVTVENYDIATNGDVTIKNYATFDEIVGVSCEFTADSNGATYYFQRNRSTKQDYAHGGIVNIINDQFDDFTSGTYGSYINKVWNKINTYTRYHYNLFRGTEDDWKVAVSGNVATIDSEEKWMTLMASTYAVSSIQRFFTAYTNGVAVNQMSKFDVTADLDFNGYSVYPIIVEAYKTYEFNNHTVHFYGKNIKDNEKILYDNGDNLINRSNERASLNASNSTQNYLMHAGLFINARSASAYKNLRLTGTIANLGPRSGALICDSIYSSTTTIDNIILDNLSVTDYASGQAGLLLGKVGLNYLDGDNSTNITINRVSTTGYSGTAPVASSLIGSVGSNDAVSVTMKFSNIVLEEHKINDATTGSGKVFRYASLIYDYQFTIDQSINKCYLIYTFMKEDCDDNVTYGDELKLGVEYQNQNRDKSDASDKLNIAIANAASGYYIPYIYKERNIYVNPRNGDITQGCGTYEDPYILDDAKQLITLYLYLTGKSVYDNVFVGSGSDTEPGGRWKVAKVGGEDGNQAECSNNLTGNTSHALIAYGRSGFPTRDDLSHAYYKIESDIDLNSIEDLNDVYIAGEFAGLGTKDVPFAGVIIGTKDDGSNYTITLPKQGTINVESGGTTVQTQLSQSFLGLIQYMGGAVVKDVNIATLDVETDRFYNVTEAGGAVAAVVCGGDNIIDNVNVSINFNISDNMTTQVRGIGLVVGEVEDGSLIFRNMQGNHTGHGGFIKKDNKNVITLDYANANGGSYSYDGEFAERIGIYVGMVYDGYVIYDGYGQIDPDGPILLDRDEISGSDKYMDMFPLVNSFHMINGDKMEKLLGSNRLKVGGTAQGYDVTIAGEDQLEILALTLNSDALSVYYCPEKNHKTAYGYYNRCRKASYDDVGSDQALSSDDRLSAMKYDNNNYIDSEGISHIGYLYPYICYRYWDYSAISDAGATNVSDGAFAANNYNGYRKTITIRTDTEVISGVSKNPQCFISNMNKASDGVANYTTTYKASTLEGGSPKTYNLKKYGYSFRGIGGVYSYDYSDFRGNFDGQNNIFTYIVSRNYNKNVYYDTTATKLSENSEKIAFHTGFINHLTYNQQMNTMNPSDEIRYVKNIVIQNSAVYNSFSYSAVATQNHINSFGIHSPATGLLCGELEGCYDINNIHVIRDEELVSKLVPGGYDVAGYKNVGGLIGRINTNVSYSSGLYSQDFYDTNIGKANKITIENCSVNGSESYPFQVTELGSALSGGNYNNANTNTGYELVHIGGLVGGVATDLRIYSGGHIFGEVLLKGNDIDYMTITAMDKGNVGGMIGTAGIRYMTNRFDIAGASAAGNVTIDGSKNESVDGSSRSSIKHLNIITNNKSNCTNAGSDGLEMSSAGGVVGKVTMPKICGGGNMIIRNYNLEDFKISEADKTGSVTARATDTYGVGGVVGSKRGHSIEFINIKLSAKDYDYNVVGSRNSPLNAGGLLGVSRSPQNNGESYYQTRTSSVIRVEGCEVQDTKVRSYLGYVGGVLGLCEEVNIYFGSEENGNSVKNCDIGYETGYIHSSTGAAAGYIAYLYHDYSQYVDSTQNGRTYVYFVNNELVDSKVLNGRYGSAGLFAYINGNNSVSTSSLYVKDFDIYSTEGNECVISSPYFAGGVYGSINNNGYLHQIYLQGHISVGANYDDSTGAYLSNAHTGVNIASQYAGGLGGFVYEKYNINHEAEIMVANNTIYAYVNNNSSNINTYSGGLYGFYQIADSTRTVKYNKVTVQDNVIMNGGSNLTTWNRTDRNLGSGGLYGSYYSNSQYAYVYLPFTSVKNNSIGYWCPTESKKIEDGNWKNKSITDQDVKLFDFSNNAVQFKNYREISNLGDDNIGDYVVGFGRLFGNYYIHYSAYSMVNVFLEEMHYDKNVGSIPLTDVGYRVRSATVNQKDYLYQEAYPYSYKSVIHIIDMNDVSGTGYEDISQSAYDSETMGTRKPMYMEDVLFESDSKQYYFGNYAAEVYAYRNLNQGVDESDLETRNYNYMMARKLNAYMPYTRSNDKYSICTGDFNYFDITYDIKDENGNTGENILNGVPVVIVDGLEVQSVADTVAHVLTNSGLNSDTMIKALATNTKKEYNAMWTVSVKNAYIDTDGTIREIKADDARFSDHKTTSVVVSDSNRIKLATSLYDKYVDDGPNNRIYSISLLCYTFSCKGAVTDNVKKIYIPVYVKEKVGLNTYLRILSNEEYSLKALRGSGYKDKVSISHDSIYTMYAELIYDGIRNHTNFVNDVAKKFITYDAIVNVIMEGTKYTMIDYQTGISYYYTADGTEENSIPFEDFKDKDGNHFVTRNISTGIDSSLSFNTYEAPGYKVGDVANKKTDTYTDVNQEYGIGVERYIIIVEPPEVKNNAVFNLNITTDCYDNNGYSANEFFTKNDFGDKNGIDVTYLPGPLIQFGGIDDETGLGTDSVTYIKGMISVDGTVEINANTEVVLSENGSPYWDEKYIGNTIDSANSNKYLEMAVTLLDENNEVVAWPAGTNISINGAPKKLLDNSLVIYSYKEIEKQFPMNDVDNNLEGKCYYYDVSEGFGEPDMHWMHYDEVEDRYYYYRSFDGIRWNYGYLDVLLDEYIEMTNQMDISLDFSAADVDDYSGKNYTVMLKLYRSDDPNYPNEGTTKSYSSSKRQYSSLIQAESNRELAVAVDANDLLDLGINLYNETSHLYNIPFTNKMDFSMMIRKASIDRDIEELSEKQKYLVTYRVYKKTNSSGQDLPAMGIGYNKNIANTIQRANGQEYQILSWDDVPFTLENAAGEEQSGETIVVNKDENGTGGETQNVIRTIETFTKDEITDGIQDHSGIQIPKVVYWDMNLKVDITDMTAEDLSNYMVTVTYLPYDSTTEAPEDDSEETLFDYFVFTIANLKTDM